jgi:hypothetical protein
MKQDAIQKKVNEVLASLDEVQPAEASPFLFSKIQYRLQQKANTTYNGALSLSWKLAYAVLFFIALNIASFYYLNQQTDDRSQNEENDLTVVVSEYAVNSTAYNF